MLPSRLRITVVAAFALAMVPLVHCNDDSLSTTPSSATIGPSGGALASSDYVIEMLVPAGALTSNVSFTITPVSAPGSGTLAPAYTITSTPSGQTFLAPVVISYTEEAITGTSFNDPSDYRVAQYESNAWTSLANPTLDLLADTVEGTTTVLDGNPYSVFVPTGGACVSVSVACGVDDGGCSVTCDPQSPGKCAAYAGAVAESCGPPDSGAGIAVSCCYPTGAPTCFTQSEPNGCESPCSQLPGSAATSCVPDIGPPLDNVSTGTSESTCCFAAGAPVCMLKHVAGSPAPVCASSSPCAGLPQGTTVASCADVSDGTLATCCLPTGTLPTSVPSGAPAWDGGVVVVTDAGTDAGAATDAGGGVDAAGESDAGGDSGGAADASDGGGVDAGADSGLDSGEDGGD
jgi:hypothetical protein